jgi:hypothetical protein
MPNTTSSRLTLHILTLTYIKHSSDPRRKLALLKHKAGPSPAVEVGVNGLAREEQNDQVYCYCWLRFICCGIGASYDTCAYSSAGQHDHGNRCCLWRGEDTD